LREGLVPVFNFLSLFDCWSSGVSVVVVYCWFLAVGCRVLTVGRRRVLFWFWCVPVGGSCSLLVVWRRLSSVDCWSLVIGCWFWLSGVSVVV
jgi:hypothetical protein